MTALKEYEVAVLRLLTTQVLTPKQLNAIVSENEFVSYEYTGCGYFLEVKHSLIPQARTVCSEPFVMGDVEGIECGFVVFMENGHLTIECHDMWDEDVPEDCRDKAVSLSVR